MASLDKLAGVDEHQAMPTKNDRPAIQDMVITDFSLINESSPCYFDYKDMVIADIEARKQVGLQRYGTLLQAFNGRDCILDAYQESLDLCVYLRQAIAEDMLGLNVTYYDALRMTLRLRSLIANQVA